MVPPGGCRTWPMQRGEAGLWCAAVLLGSRLSIPSSPAWAGDRAPHAERQVGDRCSRTGSGQVLPSLTW